MIEPRGLPYPQAEVVPQTRATARKLSLSASLAVLTRSTSSVQGRTSALASALR
jgi:hypothetical protein